MIKKIAFFAEGKTEVEFIRKLIAEIVGPEKMSLIVHDLFGKREIPTRVYSISSESEITHQCLLVDCHGDGGGTRVKQMIVDNLEKLYEAGYSYVLGLWDLYPNYSIADAPRVIRNLNKFVPTKFATVFLHVSIMEIESWFLQERSHFSRVHRLLTTAIVASLMPPIRVPEDYEKIPHPAETLKCIYAFAGKTYDKSTRDILAVVDALDYNWIVLDQKSQSPSFAAFIASVENALQC